jgi:hypothetical protein
MRFGIKDGASELGSCSQSFSTLIPVPLANVGDNLTHGNFTASDAFKIVHNFTGMRQPFKPLLNNDVLNAK